MFKLEIETGNAAFHDDHDSSFAPAEEVARILRRLAENLDGMNATWNTGNVLDYNGNTVGTWSLTDEG